MNYDPSTWTYGCEHEFADWDRSIPLPDGWGSDPNDFTMVNSNGIAVDPKAELYGFGGEVNTPATPTPLGQVELLLEFLHQHPYARVNYRSNLHVHVRLPGLYDHIGDLKLLQTFICKWMPRLFPLVDSIPDPILSRYKSPREYAGALARAKRRKKSHHTMTPEPRYKKQMRSRSCLDFFAAEVPVGSKGEALWHLQSRAAVNLRKLREPPHTIEFRHFPGTLSPKELHTCVDWCRDFLLCWFKGGNRSPVDMYGDFYADRMWPKFRPYNHSMELRYRVTNRMDCTHEAIKRNIKEILAEDEERS